MESTEFRGEDPLASLGLVDPQSGAPLPTEDWQPNAQVQAGQAALDTMLPEQRRLVDDPPHDPSQAQQQAAPVVTLPNQDTGQAQPQQNWDTPANPYYVPPEQQVVRVLQQYKQELGQQGVQMYQLLTTTPLPELTGSDQPLPEPVARTMVANAIRAASAQADAQAQQRISAPLLVQTVATDIGRRYGVDPQALHQFRSPQEMEAAAKTMASTARTTAFRQRATANTDRAEAPQGTQGRAVYDQLNSREKIRLGLRRGQ